MLLIPWCMLVFCILYLAYGSSSSSSFKALGSICIQLMIINIFCDLLICSQYPRLHTPFFLSYSSSSFDLTKCVPCSPSSGKSGQLAKPTQWERYRPMPLSSAALLPPPHALVRSVTKLNIIRIDWHICYLSLLFLNDFLRSIRIIMSYCFYRPWLLDVVCQ